ncbi:FAD-dependent oxidoreductase, partial [Streptomyces sp. RP5T]
PLTGTRAPDVPLANGGRLYESLRGGRFVLITPDLGACDGWAAHKGRLAVEHWATSRRTTVLVRPDGYVAWAAEGADPGATEAVLAAHVGR